MDQPTLQHLTEKHCLIKLWASLAIERFNKRSYMRSYMRSFIVNVKPENTDLGEPTVAVGTFEIGWTFFTT